MHDEFRKLAGDEPGGHGRLSIAAARFALSVGGLGWAAARFRKNQSRILA